MFIAISDLIQTGGEIKQRNAEEGKIFPSPAA